MKDLLERWAELEPDRCKPSSDGDWILIRSLGEKVYRGGFGDDDKLLGALIEAIEARFGLWKIAQMEDGRYKTTLVTGHSATGSTPAGSLLAAHIKALESTKEESP